MALGMQFFPDISPIVTTFAEFMGNIAWLWGVLMLVVAGLLTFFIFYEDLYEKLVKGAIERCTEKDPTKITPYMLLSEEGNILFKERRWWHNIITIHGVIMLLAATASGFWFTAPVWGITLIVMIFHQNIGIKLVEHQLKQKH